MTYEELDELFDDFYEEQHEKINDAVDNLRAVMGLKPDFDSEENEYLARDIEVILGINAIPVCNPSYEGEEKTPCYRAAKCHQYTIELCPFLKEHNSLDMGTPRPDCMLRYPGWLRPDWYNYLFLDDLSDHEFLKYRESLKGD